MSKIKFLIKFIFALFKRFKLVILFGIFFGILIFSIINLVIPKISGSKTERIGITGRYHTDQIPVEILSLISSGLTKLNESGTPEPSLADSWESPDKGKTWIFHLKKAFWQDNIPVTSSSIVYEFTDVVIERPEEKTILFKLKDPYDVTWSPWFKKLEAKFLEAGLFTERKKRKDSS